jgi:hypothetical protein
VLTGVFLFGNRWNSANIKLNAFQLAAVMEPNSLHKYDDNLNGLFSSAHSEEWKKFNSIPWFYLMGSFFLGLIIWKSIYVFAHKFSVSSLESV